MNKLIEILQQHNIDGWDKEGGTDKNGMHCYTEAYIELLSKFEDKECSLLEIGVWHGGSSLMWQEYFKKAQICGLDINYLIHDNVAALLDKSRYRFYELNAYVDSTVEKIRNENPEGFDIIIEDGIHLKGSNEFALINYLPMLKSGGVMVIEDLQIYLETTTPYEYTPNPINEGMIEYMFSLVPEGYNAEVLDLTNLRGRYDDLLFVIKKTIT